jgi:hypothetical protein
MSSDSNSIWNFVADVFKFNFFGNNGVSNEESESELVSGNFQNSKKKKKVTVIFFFFP